MARSQSTRMFTLVQREMQEYKNSLFWTPIVIAVVLTMIMLTSVLLANRISVMSDAILHVVMQEESASGMNISITIDDDDEGSYSYKIEDQSGPVDEEDWNFSKEWSFSPSSGNELQDKLDEKVESLNPILNMLHIVMLMVLVGVSVNYLLGSLYNDRKDRSILFWRSMPVSEWEEVLAKLMVVLVVAPMIFIAVSMLTQLAYVLLAMLLVYRMDMEPVELVLGNIEFVPLFADQIGGWILTALWIAPAYAWLLVASAAAKRSPFIFAVAPLIALALIEEMFLGSEYLATAVLNHIPHYMDDVDTVGFYVNGPDWSGINFLSLGLGLLFTGAALAGAVYLRRYRFEI